MDNLRTDHVEAGRLLTRSPSELVNEILKLRSQLQKAGRAMEGILIGQRMTELDNNRLRKKLNLNSSLFEKLIRARERAAAVNFMREKELTSEEMVKRNGGIHGRN